MLTINRKFEFCASHKVFNPAISDAQNADIYGPASLGVKGHGHNFQLFVVLTGPVDGETGMILELSQLKELVESTVLSRFDHRFLNEDHEAFQTEIPTLDAIARVLFSEIDAVVKGYGVKMHRSTCSGEIADLRLVCCHLLGSFGQSATAYGDTVSEVYRDIAVPLYLSHSDKPMDGVDALPSYFVQCRFKGPFDGLFEREMTQFQRNLSSESNRFSACWDGSDNPVTFLQGVYQGFSLTQLPDRLRLLGHGFQSDWYANGTWVWESSEAFLGTHRLCREGKTAEADRALFGHCTQHHGHEFTLAAAISGEGAWDPYRVSRLRETTREFVGSLSYQALDQVIHELLGQACTCERVIGVLKNRLETVLRDRLFRLRLQETVNNRFAIREGRWPC